MVPLTGAEFGEKDEAYAAWDQGGQSTCCRTVKHKTGILIEGLQKWLLPLTGVGGSEEKVRAKIYEVLFRTS